MTLDEQLAFFQTNQYLFYPTALTKDEVGRLNEAIDRNRRDHPALWSSGVRMQSVQCFLEMPETDFLVRHPSFFPAAKRILNDDIVFSEFSIMIRAGGQKEGSVEGWHRDFTPNDKNPHGVSALSPIFYLTDVDETTARYSLIPASNRIETPPAKIKEESEDRVNEKQMFGPAGSCILVNSGLWHCGRWGAGPRERRTIHMYLQPSNIPPVSNHNIFPRRLWDVKDPEQRKFYSHYNPITRAVVDDYAAKR
ncbi:MAG: phytanoyl-CoA dioxygenase family protein [Planctomycetes bacterium]|nr:phytanoyl-CoA dioxygenase family protein [Planctomycetota bacterium]